jgi:SAM-dependent methyltransferase
MVAVDAARTRSDLGVVYTPREVCEPMVRRALEPLLGQRELVVCDPAIGEGAFLIEIVRVLAEHMDGDRVRAARCLVGADIDARAVAAARAAVERFVGEPVPELRASLRVGDALALDWPRVDAVVGNPPYVRQERLGARKQALRTFASYSGVADLYVYFVELAHRITRPGGRYCLITPDKWLTAAYARPLRQFLAREGSVEGLVDFAGALPLFRDADAFPCIVWGTVGGARSKKIRARRVTEIESVAYALAEPAISHPRTRWRAEPWHVDAPADAKLIARLAERWPSLGERVAPPSRGVVTGCNRAFVIDADTRARLVAAEPAADAIIRPFAKGRDIRRWRTAPIDRYILLVDRGTSLAKLPRVRAHLAKLRSALEPRPADHRGEWPGRKPGRYRWYELQDPVVPLAKSRAPRLLYQDIQTAPACSLDETGELVPDTTVWILPSSDLVLLAILNSPLYQWYARRRFPPALNGAVRPKLEYTRALPIAEPPPRLRARIEKLVTAQLASASAERDAELARLVLDAYDLSPAERALIS